MPVTNLVNAAIETAVNKLLQLDPSTGNKLDILAGSVIELTLKEYKSPIYFYIANRRIEVLGEYEGEISVALTLSLETLIALKNKHSISDLIKHDKLIIDGDIKILQQFADLLTTLDIDWAEIVSPYVGDVIAHRLSQGVRKVGAAIKSQVQTTKLHLGDYIKHEAKITISPLEFVHFSDQIDTLSQQVDQLAQQINKLERS